VQGEVKGSNFKSQIEIPNPVELEGGATPRPGEVEGEVEGSNFKSHAAISIALEAEG
jgi:hypothetical protein